MSAKAPADTPIIQGLATAWQRERAESLLVTAYRSGITESKELVNFMGQMQHESQNFRRLEENLNYSGAVLWNTFKGTVRVPPRNGLTETEANVLAVIQDPQQRQQAIANKIYGGDWGAENLGNTGPDDGYRYRGRGYIQLTGRNNYRDSGQKTGLDLVTQPELAADKENAGRLAVQFWEDNVQSKLSDRGNVTEAGSIIITGNIGGKVKGLAERQANATAWEAALGKEGYLDSLLKRYPTTPGAPDTEPLHLKHDQQLSPESLRLLHSAEQHVRQIADRHQLPWDAGLDNTVAAVASQARHSGLNEITHLNLTATGQIRIAQYDGHTITGTSIDALSAANVESQDSLGQMAQLDRQQAQCLGDSANRNHSPSQDAQIMAM